MQPVTKAAEKSGYGTARHYGQSLRQAHCLSKTWRSAEATGGVPHKSEKVKPAPREHPRLAEKVEARMKERSFPNHMTGGGQRIYLREPGHLRITMATDSE